LGEFIRPGIAAVIIKRGVAITHLGLFVNQVPALKTAGRQLPGARKGDAVTSGPKFFQFDHQPVLFLPPSVQDEDIYNI